MRSIETLVKHSFHRGGVVYSSKKTQPNTQVQPCTHCVMTGSMDTKDKYRSVPYTSDQCVVIRSGFKICVQHCSVISRSQRRMDKGGCVTWGLPTGYTPSHRAITAGGAERLPTMTPNTVQNCKAQHCTLTLVFFSRVMRSTNFTTFIKASTQLFHLWRYFLTSLLEELTSHSTFHLLT